MILIPPGYNHEYQIHVIRDIHSDAGDTNGTGGRKGVTHITVTNERHVHTAAQILIDEGFEPNVLFGFDLHSMRPYLYQFAPLDHASKSLQHPPGTPETNRGGEIVCQMEIACEPSDVPNFPQIGMYKCLANAWRLINVCLGSQRIPWEVWGDDVLKVTPPCRLEPDAFLAASGHGGHRNVPNQPDEHDDPTGAFNWVRLMNRLHKMPPGGWNLTGTGF